MPMLPSSQRRSAAVTFFLLVTLKLELLPLVPLLVLPLVPLLATAPFTLGGMTIAELPGTVNELSALLPFHVYLSLPSCIGATPDRFGVSREPVPGVSAEGVPKVGGTNALSLLRLMFWVSRDGTTVTGSTEVGLPKSACSAPAKSYVSAEAGVDRAVIIRQAVVIIIIRFFFMSALLS